MIYKIWKNPYPRETQKWWQCAIMGAVRGPNVFTEMHDRLLAVQRGAEWICGQDTLEKARRYWESLPGWHEAPQDHPLLWRRLSPAEEKEILLSCPPDTRGEFAAECVCPPDAPRRLRRAAEAAWHRWVTRRLRELAQQPG